MVNETAQVAPTNRVVLDNRNIRVTTKKLETIANCYAGHLVMKGTNSDDVLVTDAASKGYGWIGYEQTTKKYRPATVDTIYVVNDQAAIINGPGIVLNAEMGLQTTITKGQLLTSAASGYVTPGVAGTDDIVAQAEEDKATTTVKSRILVRSRI
jgi:hypothetical protein